jgi:hypothetical protein
VVKIIYILLCGFMLVACSDSKTTSENNKVTTASGNLTAQSTTLSAQNDSDISSDLAALNAIMNKANSEAVSLREAMIKAAQSGDKSAVLAETTKVKTQLEGVNTTLSALTLKSQEVQAVRVKILDGNMRAIKLSELAMKQEKTSEDTKEMQLLQKQSVAMQQSVGKTLDELNAKYRK